MVYELGCDGLVYESKLYLSSCIVLFGFQRTMNLVMSPKIVYVVVVLRLLMSKLCILKYMMGVGEAICEAHGSKQ
jgi:hypothetical protein